MWIATSDRVEEINTALTKLVEHCSKCKDCVYNHNNRCFFVIPCTNNDFEIQKRKRGMKNEI